MSHAGSKPAVPAQLPPISEETLRRLLATQEAKIALEMKHAEIALREVDHNQKIADKSIEAQAEDRKDERRLAKSLHTQRVILIGGAVLCVFTLVVAAMVMNKDAIAYDILKIIMGFVGGYGTNAALKKKSDDAGD